MEETTKMSRRPGENTKKLKKILATQNKDGSFFCYYCKRRLHQDIKTIEHLIIPFSVYPKSQMVVYSCRKCNNFFDEARGVYEFYMNRLTSGFPFEESHLAKLTQKIGRFKYIHHGRAELIPIIHDYACLLEMITQRVWGEIVPPLPNLPKRSLKYVPKS
jgi:hypothetical protein